MKRLKKAIVAMFILNLLLVLGGLGWLLSSGRVSKERVLELTELFDEPVVVEEARLKAEEAAAKKALEDQEHPIPALALNAQERNQVRVEITQIDRQRLERMRREVADMQATLRKERRLVEEDRLALEQEREAFQQMRQRLANLEGGQQFQKSLSTLTGMAPKNAKAVLATLLEGGGGLGDKYEEVISYLSAMDDRKRTQIMTEFVKAGDEELAADLLESVRLRGLETTQGDGTSP